MTISIRSITAVVVVSLLLWSSGVNAASCSTPISSCGCEITFGGVYVTSGALISASATVDCIDVTASNVVLILAGDITGPGGGVTADGIHLMSTASNSFVEGANTLGSFTTHTISGFATGIQDDASGVLIDLIKANGNVHNGIALTSASNCIVGNSTANGNTGLGMLSDAGFNNSFPNDEADSNADGFEITGGSGSVINDSGASMNTGYGMWIKRSNGNAIKDSSTTHNPTGMYIGCAASGGPTGKPCNPSVPPANLNKVQQSGANNGTIGVAIDKGDSLNRVIVTGAVTNTTFDFIDKNGGCDHNVWLGDAVTGTTKKPGCIH
jgi:hypothetical protein